MQRNSYITKKKTQLCLGGPLLYTLIIASSQVMWFTQLSECSRSALTERNMEYTKLAARVQVT